MRVRTETCEIRRAGEKSLIGDKRRIEQQQLSLGYPLGLAGGCCQPEIGTVPQQTSKWLIKPQKVRKTQ
jgi:hypothetical protein